MADWIETFKGVIHASEYDPNAHMNSQAYVSRFDQATWFLLAGIELTPRKVRERGLRIAVLRQSFQFVRELRGWELVTIESGFIAVGGKHLRFLHRMFDAEARQLAATSECTAVLASLAEHRAVPLDADIAARAKSQLVTINDALRVDLDAQL